jgi:hypothetical protein
LFFALQIMDYRQQKLQLLRCQAWLSQLRAEEYALSLGLVLDTIHAEESSATKPVPTAETDVFTAEWLDSCVHDVLKAAYKLPFKNGQPNIARALLAAVERVIPAKMGPLGFYGSRAAFLAIAAALEESHG